MKKWFIPAAVLLLTLCCAIACAQSTYLMSITDDTGADVFDVVLNTASDDIQVNFESDVSDSGMFLITRDGAAPLRVFIYRSDLAENTDLSLADMTEEQLEQLKASAGEEYEQPTFELLTTPSGNQYLKTCSGDENSDIDQLITLYRGAIIEILQYREDFSRLNEADEAFCLEVFHGIEFEPVEAQ